MPLLLVFALATSCFTAAAATPFAQSPFGPAISGTRIARDDKDPAHGNQLVMVGNGYDALLLRVHLIRHARESIDIQTFIWTNDECGRLVMYELVEAARRGVKVRIIADHMFSDQNPDIVAFLATVHPNLETKHYRPAMSRLKPSLWQTLLAGLSSFRDVNQRMHNKVMLFDGAILLTGGRNFENTYFDHSTTLNFRDRDVLAIGPVAAAARKSFEEFWTYRHSVPSRKLTDVADAIRRNTFKRFPTRDNYVFGPHFATLDSSAEPTLVATRLAAQLRPVRKAFFLADEPGKSRQSTKAIARITGELHGLITQAKKAIVIQTPYLVLSRPARTVFKEIQQRNPALRIRVSTNSFASTDNLLAYSANFRLRNEYVEQLKLQIHEFRAEPASLPRLFPRHGYMSALARAEAAAAGKPARTPFLSLHAKSLVVDDTLAFIGSYNLDPRSENLNTEVGLLVEDDVFARELRAEIEDDMQPANSWVIARRPLPLRFDAVNALVDGLISATPLDLWPIQNTSSFELRPGAEPLPPDHPAFYERYREVGSFPGTDGFLSQKEILTRLYKAVGAPLTPVI